MPYIRCQFVGTGVDLDPYRVPLPSYQDIIADYVDLTDVVLVSPRLWTPALNNAAGTVHTEVSVYTVVTAVSPDTLVAWYALLDRLYGEGGVNYRPVIA